MSIIKKLIEVQDKLRAPKDQKNAFANYKFRSAESILEAVKPLLKEQGLYLSMTDSVDLVGARFYVKATVTVEDEEGNSKSVSALAREEDTKKGFDSSQITGASSSYARKYALSGLFAIDDNRDSDATNDHKDDKQPTPPQAQTTPKEPVKPKAIIVGDETYNKSLNHLIEKGLSVWPELYQKLVKNNFTMEGSVEAELLKEVGLALKNKKQESKQ